MGFASKMSLRGVLTACALSCLIANPVLAKDTPDFGGKLRETKTLERLAQKNALLSKSKIAKLQKEERQKFANAFGAFVAYLHASDHAKLRANITKSSFARARSNLILLSSGKQDAKLVYTAVQKVERLPIMAKNRVIVNNWVLVSGFAVYVVPYQFAIGNAQSELKTATVFSKIDNRSVMARAQQKPVADSKAERPIAPPECNDAAPMPSGTFFKPAATDIGAACFSNAKTDKLALN